MLTGMDIAAHSHSSAKGHVWVTIMSALHMHCIRSFLGSSQSHTCLLYSVQPTPGCTDAGCFGMLMQSIARSLSRRSLTCAVESMREAVHRGREKKSHHPADVRQKTHPDIPATTQLHTR